MLKALSGIPTNGPLLAEAADHQGIFFELAPRHRVDPENWSAAAFEDLKIAFVGTFQARCAVAKTGGQIIAPHRGRRIHVRVRRDQLVHNSHFEILTSPSEFYRHVLAFRPDLAMSPRPLP